MEKDNGQPYEISYLIEVVKEQFYRILRSNPAKWNIAKEEILRWESGKLTIRNMLKSCGYGDENARAFVQSYMREFVQKYGGINTTTIENAIPFENPPAMEFRVRFLILLMLREREVGKQAISSLIEQYGWNKPRYDSEEEQYEITKQDVDQAFYKEYQGLSYEEKLAVLVQRIYETYLGYGIIDRVLTMSLDGVSAGVSKDEKTIWIFYRGTTIHMPCLSFESEKEMIRVCRNLYRYGNQGQLSQEKGYITGSRKDGSRVVVMRPSFSESWAFFVRKFDTAKQLRLRDILKRDRRSELEILLKWITKGCQVTGITGQQGSGKTTLLMAMIEMIPCAYTIRVQELTFELQLRERYPDRNILSLKETESISGQEALDLLKKTDGVVTILGEVATHPVASWLIQVSQTASLFTMFTHHAKTTKDLMEGLRNALLKEGGFQNERVALEQVVSSIRFDIHMAKTREGERYVERITEIIPNDSEKNGYELHDLILWEQGEYKRKWELSKEVRTQILKQLTLQEKQQFLLDMGVLYGN